MKGFFISVMMILIYNNCSDIVLKLLIFSYEIKIKQLLICLGEPDAASLQKAKEHLNNALKLEPNNSELYSKLGIYYRLMGDELSCKTNLTKALQLNANNEEAKTLMS